MSSIGSNRLTRRTALSLIGLGIGGSLLAACAAPAATPTSAPVAAPTASGAAAKPTTASPAATSAPAAAAAATTAPGSEQIKRGGTLRWGQVGDIVTADAVLSSPASNETTGACCDVLVTYDDQLNPVARLAESWEFSTDNKRIKLNLRKGVTFHSGREFTSEDVNYNVLRARDPKNPYAAVVAPGSAWWTNIEMPDKSTIILTSEQPRPGVYDWLNFLRIQDKEVLEGPNATNSVGGTGPFKWVEWVQGDHIYETRNKDYWETGHPYVDDYQIKIFRDQQSMITALEAGALDVAALAPIPDAVRLASDPKYQVYETHSVGQYFYSVVNTTVPPTDNKLFRQALGYAIDRKRFTETIMKGYVGDPKNLPWTSTSPAYEPNKNNTYTFDLDKARALIEQSGVKNPEFDIAWATAGFTAEYAALGQVIQSDLAKIGVKTNLKPTEPAAFTAAGNGRTPPYNGMRLSAGAYAQLYEAASEFVLSRTMGYASNLAGFYDPAFEQMVTSATTEPDATKRKALYSQINDYLLDVAYVHTVSAYGNINAMTSKVHGLRYEPSTFVTLRDIWLG
jgi:peptide/nickel transport system substrate-binding protein